MNSSHFYHQPTATTPLTRIGCKTTDRRTDRPGGRARSTDRTGQSDRRGGLQPAARSPHTSRSSLRLEFQTFIFNMIKCNCSVGKRRDSTRRGARRPDCLPACLPTSLAPRTHRTTPSRIGFKFALYINRRRGEGQPPFFRCATGILMKKANSFVFVLLRTFPHPRGPRVFTTPGTAKIRKTILTGSGADDQASSPRANRSIALGPLT